MTILLGRAIGDLFTGPYRRAVAYADQFYGWLTPLSADDFALHERRPEAPF